MSPSALKSRCHVQFFLAALQVANGWSRFRRPRTTSLADAITLDWRASSIRWRFFPEQALLSDDSLRAHGSQWEQAWFGWLYRADSVGPTLSGPLIRARRGRLATCTIRPCQLAACTSHSTENRNGPPRGFAYRLARFLELPIHELGYGFRRRRLAASAGS